MITTALRVIFYLFSGAFFAWLDGKWNPLPLFIACTLVYASGLALALMGTARWQVHRENPSKFGWCAPIFCWSLALGVSVIPMMVESSTGLYPSGSATTLISEDKK